MSKPVKYIETVQELEEVALSDLGTLRSLTHAQATATAATFAVPFKLVLDIRYKPGMSPVGCDIPYLISADEWHLFISQIDEYCRAEPHVYVIDATRFTAQI